MSRTPAEIEAACAVMRDNGIDINGPWSGYLDDRERELFYALVSSLDAADQAAWRPIEEAPKDGTPILLLLKNSIDPKREDLERWNGLQFVGRHPGIFDNGFDIGWNVAAPVGHGGFPDAWFVGWRPLPLPPSEPA